MTKHNRRYMADHQNPGFTIVTYKHELLTDEEQRARVTKGIDKKTMEQEIYSNPVTAYLYNKQLEDMCTVRRLSKQPKFSNYNTNQLLDHVKRNSSNDSMPLILRKAKHGSEDISPHAILKGIKQVYRTSARERRIEQNAEAGKFEPRRYFTGEFIDQVKDIRNIRNMTQKDLALLVDVNEYDIRSFEAGDMTYNGTFRANLMRKLGM